MSPWVTVCLISHPVKAAVAGISNFAEDQWVWRKKTDVTVTSLEPHFNFMKTPKMCNCGLQQYLLHSCVGCTADVTGDHHQAARMEARHHRSQIDLEPQLKVFRLKVIKFRSKGCQGHVQDGVPYNWIWDEGVVSLKKKKRIHVSVQEHIVPFWNHCRNENKFGDTSLYCTASGARLKASSAAIRSTRWSKMCHFQSKSGPLLASAKVPWTQDKFYTACLSANVPGKYGNLKS